MANFFRALGKSEALPRELSRLTGLATELRSRKILEEQRKFQNELLLREEGRKDEKLKIQQRKMKLVEEEAERENEAVPILPMMSQVDPDVGKFLYGVGRNLGIIDEANPQNPTVTRKNLKEFLGLLNQPPFADKVLQIKLGKAIKGYQDAKVLLDDYMEKKPDADPRTDKKVAELMQGVQASTIELQTLTKYDVDMRKVKAEMAEKWGGEKVEKYWNSPNADASILGEVPKKEEKPSFNWDDAVREIDKDYGTQVGLNWVIDPKLKAKRDVVQAKLGDLKKKGEDPYQAYLDAKGYVKSIEEVYYDALSNSELNPEEVKSEFEKMFGYLPPEREKEEEDERGPGVGDKVGEFFKGLNPFD